ncbi:MAG: lysostaphin resistance A-like protein [Promethearchaeota archaeon]
MSSNLLYFTAVAPAVSVVGVILWRYAKERPLARVGVICVTLFFVRLSLTLFEDTIGIVPKVLPDVVFYSVLAAFGITFAWAYARKVEGLGWSELGWSREHIGLNIAAGLLGFVPLALTSLLPLRLGVIEPVNEVTWQKVVVGVTFGWILGGFYEEVVFRGVVQFRLSESLRPVPAILLTAAIFTASHLWYLPFAGYGVLYLFVLEMALLLGFLRWKVGQLACFVLHGGVVFVLVLLT